MIPDRQGPELGSTGVSGSSFAYSLRAFDRAMILMGRSERTREQYRYRLTKFVADYLYRVGRDLADATREDVEEWLLSLRRQGRGFPEAARALKAFYRWAQDAGVRADNPAAHVKLPRTKLTPAPDLSAEDLRALLRAAFRHRSARWGPDPRRGWAIMLLFKTGARISSFCAIRPEDLHLEASPPYVWLAHTKGDRPYKAFLDRAGVIAARHLLREHAANPRPRRSDTLLGVGPAQVRNWLHAAEQVAGLPRVWPHLLRHAFSNRVARRGDIEAWRRAMNHADLSQWPRYVDADAERVAEATAGIW